MTPVPPIKVSAEEWRIVEEILRRLVPDREVWCFGSRAKGTARRYSDLDLAILGDERLDLALRATLREDFSESDLPFKVDVVDWAATQPYFQEIIAAQHVVVHSRGAGAVEAGKAGDVEKVI